MTRQCPLCGSTYPLGTDFCGKDGARLLDPDPAAPPPDPRAGEVIDRFQLVRCIGQGGMGAVYLATHRVLNRPFAIKLMHAEFTQDPRALSRFLREAKVASALDHPNLIGIYDYGQTGQGEPYLVLEYVAGISLAAACADSPSQRLPPGRAVDIAIQLARALAHAHERGVVHRDIKPANVLLSERDGLPDWVKVVDFGIARMIGLETITQPGDGLAGTPEYIAPERLDGRTEAAPPEDLYAVGILLHEVLAGAPPFEGEITPVLMSHLSTVPPLLSQRAPELRLPPDLDLLVARLLDKDPGRRPGAAEAVRLLEQVRPKLPPRSLGGLLAARTLILGISERATVLLPPDRRGAGIHALETAILPSRMQAFEQIEGEVARLDGMLAEKVAALGQRLWPAGWPAAAEALRRRLAECEQAAQATDIDLALLQDRLDEDRRAAERRRHEIRREILDLSERVKRERGLLARDRETLVAQLYERERAFAEAVESGELRLELAQACRRLQELRDEMGRALVLVARHLLSCPCPPALAQERAAAQDLLEQAEAAHALMSLHLDRLRPRGA